MKAISRLNRFSSDGHGVESEKPAKETSGSPLLVAAFFAIAGFGQPVLAQVQEPCGVSALCLGEGRYQFLAFWTDPESGDQNVAHPVSLTADSGYFWFFGPTNIEITVKVLDGCNVNGSEWVFIAGMTNLSVRLEVSDVQSATHKTYRNPQGAAFQPVQDTAAFPNCPGGSAAPIAGTWTGTFDSADSADCDSHTPAEASFTEQESAVTGTLSAPTNYCGPDNAQFAGTLQGDTLSGTVTGRDFAGGRYANAHVFGTLTGVGLELTVVNGFGLIPGGTLHLHR